MTSPSRYSVRLLAATFAFCVAGVQAQVQMQQKQGVAPQMQQKQRPAAIHVAPAPSVEIVALSATPAAPKQGEMVTFKLSIRNTGTTAVASLPWAIHWYTVNQTLAQGTLTNVGAGAQFEVTASWKAVAGEQLIQGYVDAANTIKNAAPITARTRNLTLNTPLTISEAADPKSKAAADKAAADKAAAAAIAKFLGGGPAAQGKAFADKAAADAKAAADKAAADAKAAADKAPDGGLAPGALQALGRAIAAADKAAADKAAADKAAADAKAAADKGVVSSKTAADAKAAADKGDGNKAAVDAKAAAVKAAADKAADKAAADEAAAGATNVVASPGGSGQVTVTFTAPANPAGYVAVCQPQNGNLSLTRTGRGAASPLTVTGLQPEISYTCTVAVASGGPLSAPSNSVTAGAAAAIRQR